MKQKPLGICDLCGAEIPKSRWYTSRGLPRCYCSRECRNTANSRSGSEIRRIKTLARIKAGRWINPKIFQTITPEEQSRRAKTGRLREVAEGRWRNPALTPEAREKLSRPRKHTGALHRAMEKLRHGKMSDLSDEEREAWYAYRKQLKEKKN